MLVDRSRNRRSSDCARSRPRRPRAFLRQPRGFWDALQPIGDPQHIRAEWEKLAHYQDQFDARIEPYLLAYLGITLLAPIVDRYTRQLGRAVEMATLHGAGGDQGYSRDLFRSWSLFDARAVLLSSAGAATHATASYASIARALCVARGFDSEWIRTLSVLSDSRLGLHVVHDASSFYGIEGCEGVCVLRELVTRTERTVFLDRAFLPLEGDLLLARVLPPLSGSDRGYALDICLVEGCDRGAWGNWFDRMLAGQSDRIAAYEGLMKLGGGPLGSCLWLEYATRQRLCVPGVPTLWGVPGPAMTGP